jgi:hypothetical protein
LRFNATLASMGDASHVHHLHTFFVEKLPGHRDVEAHASAAGRYKVKITPHDGKDHPPTSLSLAGKDGPQETAPSDSKSEKTKKDRKKKDKEVTGEAATDSDTA